MASTILAALLGESSVDLRERRFPCSAGFGKPFSEGKCPRMTKSREKIEEKRALMAEKLALISENVIL
jgi:hypothetical protein